MCALAVCYFSNVVSFIALCLKWAKLMAHLMILQLLFGNCYCRFKMGFGPFSATSVRPPGDSAR